MIHCESLDWMRSLWVNDSPGSAGLFFPRGKTIKYEGYKWSPLPQRTPIHSRALSHSQFLLPPPELPMIKVDYNESLFFFFLVFACLFIGKMSRHVICPKFFNMRKYFVVGRIHTGTAEAISDAQSKFLMLPFYSVSVFTRRFSGAFYILLHKKRI